MRYDRHILAVLREKEKKNVWSFKEEKYLNI